MLGRQPPKDIMKDPLFEILKPVRKTAVVVIGANPIDIVPPVVPVNYL